MRSDPPKARVQVRDLEVALGPVQAKVIHGEVDLVAKPGQDKLVLDQAVVPRVRAAEATVAASELVDAVRASLGAKAGDVLDGLEVVLSGKERFLVRGRGPTGEPFSMEGLILSRGGRLLLVPTRGEARIDGLPVALDVPAAKGTVRVSPEDVASRLSALRDSSGRPRILNPVVHGLGDGTLQFSATVRKDGQLMPLAARVKPEVLPSGNLGMRLFDVRVEAAGHEAHVDLVRGKAQVEADWSEMRRVIGGILGGMVPNAAVAPDGQGGIRVTGEATTGTFVDLPDRRGPLGRTPVQVVTDMALSATPDGRMQAHLKRFEAKGPFIELGMDGLRDKVDVRLPERGLLALLGEVMGPGVRVGALKPTSDRTFRARIGDAGQELEIDGRIDNRGGDLAVHLEALHLPGGWGRAVLSGKGEALEARLDWAELARGIERQLPLRGVSLKPGVDGRVQIEGRLALLGVPVLPVKLEIRPHLETAGGLGADVLSCKVAGAGLMGILEGTGLSLERLAGKGLFAGNRLKLGDLPLPPGLTPGPLSAGSEGLSLKLRADSRALGIGPTVKLDGPTLTLGAQATLGLPGPVTSLSLATGALVLEAAVSERGLLPMLPKMPGVDVSRTRLVLPMGLGVGEAQATRLQDIKVGPEGATLTVDARPLVQGSMADLPQGMALRGDLLEVEIPRPAGLPIRTTDVRVRGDGVDVVVGMTREALTQALPRVGEGVRWAEDGVEIDLEAWAPGAKVREARVEDGALRLGLGAEAEAPRGMQGSPVRVRTDGRVQVHGFVLEGAEVLVRPPASGPLQIDKLGPKDIKLRHGQVLVSPAKLDALLRETMGKDYAKLAPRLDGDRLVIQDGPIGLPVSLAVEAAKDGSLKLVPTSILGRSSFLEIPQMFVGMMLKPLTSLIPDDPRQSVDLAKVSGADLPPLQGARITEEGLWLDFGNAWQKQVQR
ncbi:MAG: hypothetical protein VKO64_00195 [Candidatus Sericytochromatia bacterium]|nr:hypothetical protein [Candidatus Sericytochromatia bacterium]